MNSKNATNRIERDEKEIEIKIKIKIIMIVEYTREMTIELPSSFFAN